MKTRKIIAMLTGSVFLFVGCIQEEWTPGSGTEEGAVRIALSIGDPEQVATRSEASANECKIDDAYLLVFDTDGKYKSGEKVNLSTQITNKDNNAKTPVINTQLRIKSGDKIVVLLNTRVADLPEGLTVGVTDTSQINGLFPATGWNLNPANVSTFRQSLPMSGEMIFGADPVCHIKRSVAKIQLRVNIPPGEITLDNVRWTMYHELTQTKGAVYAPNGAVTTIGGLTAGDFGNGTFDKWNTSIFYTPEYPSATKARETAVDDATFSANRTSMILQSKNKYYRLDLYDHTAKKYIDIRRNTHITVTITKVKLDGYDTADEALANPGSNLEYDITVSGENDNVIVSNGQYALSLEYDEMIVVGAETNVEFTVGNIRALRAAGVSLPSTNSIMASGLTLTGATAVSEVDQPIKAKFTGTIAAAGSTGTITVKLGNLTKRINVLAFPGSSVPGCRKTFTGKYSAVKWLHKEEGIDVIQNGTTSITVSYSDNIIPTNASALSDPAVVPIFAPRKAEGFVLRGGGNPGRTKIIVSQTAVPVYVGWFGGAPDNSYGRYSKRLIFDSQDSPIMLMWFTKTDTYQSTSHELGLANTQALMALSSPTNYQAARYCYMLNDRNGNGRIDPDEPVNWYLPAYCQLISIYITKEGLNTSFSNTSLWSSSESGNYNSYVVSFEGYIVSASKQSTLSVRCVRDL